MQNRFESELESNWYQLCLSYYEHTDADGLKALEYFHRLDPSTLPQASQRYDNADTYDESYGATNHGGDLALLGIRATEGTSDADIAILIKCGFHPPHAFTIEHWQRYNDIKNQARSEAHRLGMSRRVDSTRAYITTMASQAGPSQAAYSDISALLLMFLRNYAGDIGLLSFINGMHKWLLSHLPANGTTSATTTNNAATVGPRPCMQWRVPGEVFSERSPEFTADSCRLLLSLGQLSTSSETEVESGEYVFTWTLRRHLSDAYLVRLGKTIRNKADIHNLKHFLGSISSGNTHRTNADGQLDDFVPYIVNKLSCPIL